MVCPFTAQLNASINLRIKCKAPLYKKTSMQKHRVRVSYKMHDRIIPFNRRLNVPTSVTLYRSDCSRQLVQKKN